MEDTQQMVLHRRQISPKEDITGRVPALREHYENCLFAKA